MSEHGKEPWRIECLKDDGDCEFMRSADGIDSIPVYWLGNDDRTASANARRIVACVNACRGMFTDELESMEPDEDGCMILDKLFFNYECERIHREKHGGSQP